MRIIIDVKSQYPKTLVLANDGIMMDTIRRAIVHAANEYEDSDREGEIYEPKFYEDKYPDMGFEIKVLDVVPRPPNVDMSDAIMVSKSYMREKLEKAEKGLGYIISYSDRKDKTNLPRDFREGIEQVYGWLESVQLEINKAGVFKPIIVDAPIDVVECKDVITIALKYIGIHSDENADTENMANDTARLWLIRHYIGRVQAFIVSTCEFYDEIGLPSQRFSNTADMVKHAVVGEATNE